MAKPRYVRTKRGFIVQRRTRDDIPRWDPRRWRHPPEPPDRRNITTRIRVLE